MKELFGAITFLLALASCLVYVHSILKLRTKPHLYTCLVWAIVTTLLCIAQYQGGAGPGAWGTGVIALFTCVVLLLSISYGTKDVTSFDGVLLVLALIAIIPWWLTQDLVLTVILAVIIDVLAFIPTLRKLLNAPESESLLSWVLNLVRHVLSLFALATYTLVTYLYPLTLLCMSALIVGVILTKRTKTLA